MSSTNPNRGIPINRTRLADRAVRRWRRRQLLAVGFDEFTAYRMAANTQVDVHVMLLAREQRHDLDATGDKMKQSRVVPER